MKIFLAGDSTVAPQPIAPGSDPGLRYSSWGQMLPRFLDDVEVRNLAVNGYTIDAFRNQGQYDIVKSELAPGDYVFIQFGHNDAKRIELRADQRYLQLLISTGQEIRSLGGIPVLVTSVARNSWRGDDGEYLDLLAPYAAATRVAATVLKAPCLDLHRESVAWIKQLGLAQAKRFFGPGDYTHPNDYGAYHWATLLIAEILKNSHPDLAKLKPHIKPQSAWDNLEVAGSKANPVTGWLGPAPTRAGFVDWLADGSTVTYADALAIARVFYNWFVSGQPDAPADQLDLICAQENGYLPADFPRVNLNQPIDAASFKEFMLFAYRGRSAHVPAHTTLDGVSGPITGKDARAFLEALETPEPAK